MQAAAFVAETKNAAIINVSTKIFPVTVAKYAGNGIEKFPVVEKHSHCPNSHCLRVSMCVLVGVGPVISGDIPQLACDSCSSDCQQSCTNLVQAYGQAQYEVDYSCTETSDGISVICGVYEITVGTNYACTDVNGDSLSCGLDQYGNNCGECSAQQTCECGKCECTVHVVHTIPFSLLLFGCV